jgi:hypothetical protein
MSPGVAGTQQYPLIRRCKALSGGRLAAAATLLAGSNWLPLGIPCLAVLV